MTDARLTMILAERVMGWGVGPNRFLLSGRRWLPRWRFQPTKKLTDALRLLEAATPQEYSIAVDAKGYFWVKVRIGGNCAQARDRSKPLAICRAVAAAVGINGEKSD